MNDKTIILGIAGAKSSGKNTLGNFFDEILTEKGLVVNQFAFADPVRDGLLALDPYIAPNIRLSDEVSAFGWDNAKTSPEVRRLLQRFGTEAGRDLHGEDLWTNLMDKRIRTHPCDVAIITDVRFPNEAGFIVDRDGYLFHVIKRESTIPLDTVNYNVNHHVSERMAHHKIQHATTILNDSTLDDLKELAEKEINKLFKDNHAI